MNRCGVFDSGIGGFSVAKEILKAKLFEKVIYYGDTARVPYGSKNKNTIISYSLETVEFFKNFDIDILVVACNSVSAVAIEEMKKEANFKIIGVIEAGIEAVKNEDKNSNILLIGTKTTINSNAYQKELKKLGFKNITSIATPLLVPLVEEGIFEGKIVDDIFDLYFSKVDKNSIDIIILGCTHYPFLEKSFKKHFPKAKLIHSGQAIVNLLKKEFNLKEKKSSNIEIYASDNVEEVREIANKWIVNTN